MNKSQVIQEALKVLKIEMSSAKTLKDTFNDSFYSVVKAIYNTKGRLIVTGIGKSGHIANKIASTLSSTGTPSQFVHPSEASHGDLGMIEKNDVIIALSKSGETKEMIPLINYAKTYKNKLIAITAKSNSFLSKNAHVSCLIPNIKESCPLNLAPTTSTTMMLVLGDAIAIELMKIKKFKKEDFKKNHPGGMLGKSLLAVENIMHIGKDIPLINISEKMSTALLKMTSNGFGCVGVVSNDNELQGIITDGDLRRNISKNFLKLPIKKVMTKKPLTINKQKSVMDALEIMNRKKITALFITETNSYKPLGILHIHDCLKIG